MLHLMLPVIRVLSTRSSAAILTTVPIARNYRYYHRQRTLRTIMSENGNQLEDGCPGAGCTRTEMQVEDWSERWEVGRIGFHKTQIQDKLSRFKDELIAGRESLKILFPLCGKAIDMKLMYDEGHTIVGIEGAPKGVEDFFLENDLTYVAEPVKEVDGAVYKTEDGRLQIYCCDFFKFTPNVEKDFTAVFDRASFSAINVTDRKRYADTVLPLLAPDCRYMLVSTDFDGSKYAGPPHNVSEEDVEAAFGPHFTIKFLDCKDAFEPKHTSWGLSAFVERAQLLTLKASE